VREVTTGKCGAGKYLNGGTDGADGSDGGADCKSHRLTAILNSPPAVSAALHNAIKIMRNSITP